MHRTAVRTALQSIVAGTAFALAAAPVAAKDDPAAARLKDVEFLLDELGKRTQPLLRQKGVDWKAVEKEFLAAAKGLKTDEDLLVLCGRLVARLRDGHAGVVETKLQWPDESKGRAWGGPGVALTLVGDDVRVRNAWGPAAGVGLSAGQKLSKIDGKPARAWLDAKVAEMRDRNGYSTDHQALYAASHWGLGDWEGTQIRFSVAGGKTEEVTRGGRVSTIPYGPVFPPKDLKSAGRQSYGRTAKGFAYVHLRDVPGEILEQLDTMLAEVGNAPGLVLDCRANGGGGGDHAAIFGRFVASGTTWRQYPSAGAKPYAGPMVVIVDAGVRSAGETVAGQFKEDGRAYMIGDSPTAGMSSQKDQLTVPSGLLTVRFSVGSNKGRFNGGKGIEGIGVPPHEVVPYDARDLAKEVDTQIRRAEELLAKGFPKGAVPYEPPKKK